MPVGWHLRCPPTTPLLGRLALGAARARYRLCRQTLITAATTLPGLLGWPVSHSLSPRMQNAAFAARALDWVYVPLPVPPEGLAEAVRGLAALGFAGANVTIPHKVAVAELCDEL